MAILTIVQRRMILLRTLGKLAVEGLDADAERFVLAGGKRVGLLIYLMVAGRGTFVRRDTLLAIFWPEADETRARGALRSLMHQIRSGLGDGVLVTRADNAIAINPERITCDVVQFHAACDAGDWQRATILLQGPLLDGFGIAGAAAFEDWLAAERERVRARYVEITWREAQESGAMGDRKREINALQQLLGWAPYDERAVQRLMTVLEDAGDRTAALHVFHQFATRLAHELELEPEAETSALVGAIRARAGARAELRSDGRRGSVSATGSSAVLREPPPRERSHTARATVAVVLVAVGALAALLAARRQQPLSLDHRLVAALPFHTFPSDTALARLGEAMPLLIDSRLQASPAMRVADEGATLRAVQDHWTGWPDQPATYGEATRVGRDVGAAHVLLGSIKRAPHGILIQATLVAGENGKPVARASVEGGTHDIDALVDRLTISILARAAAEPEQRLPFLARAPLQAGLWYLEGQRLLRAEQPRKALDAFVTSLEFDSTFATAALAASVAAGSGGTPWLRRGLEIAWRSRDLLAPLDYQIVAAKLGPRYPQPSSLAEQLVAWERLVAQTVGHPYAYEALFGYADHVFHYGRLLGIDDALEQARSAFEKASRVDSTFPGAVQHLADLAFMQRDTARLRSWVTRLLAHPNREIPEWTPRWMLAAAINDTVALAQVPKEFASLLLYNLSLHTGVRADDADRVATIWRDQATTLQQTVEQQRVLWQLALNRGRASQAAALHDSITRITGSVPHLGDINHAADRFAVLAALYWEGDLRDAREQNARLRRRAAAGPGSREMAALNAWYRDLCTVEEANLAVGDLTTVDRTIAALDTAAPGPRICRRVLTAYRAVVHGDPDARAQLDSLDAFARTAPPAWVDWYGHGNLLIARLYERLGAPDRAYAAVKRRGLFTVSFTMYLSAHLREEARLARMTGDTVQARRAQQHYDGLRSRRAPGRLVQYSALGGSAAADRSH